MTEEFIENLKVTNLKEFTSGIYEVGRYAWIPEDVKVLDKPIEIKGQLGLWNFEAEVASIKESEDTEDGKEMGD